MTHGTSDETLTPLCGHSLCFQYYVDTGGVECIEAVLVMQYSCDDCDISWELEWEGPKARCPSCDNEIAPRATADA